MSALMGQKANVVVRAAKAVTEKYAVSADEAFRESAAFARWPRHDVHSTIRRIKQRSELVPVFRTQRLHRFTYYFASAIDRELRRLPPRARRPINPNLLPD